MPEREAKMEKEPLGLQEQFWKKVDGEQLGQLLQNDCLEQGAGA
jgi:hypothetical protein